MRARGWEMAGVRAGERGKMRELAGLLLCVFFFFWKRGGLDLDVRGDGVIWGDRGVYSWKGCGFSLD